MVVLGKAPDGGVEREFKDLAAMYNRGHQIRILVLYGEELSQLLYDAADLVLVPSLYEPCGLAQMIGMRYGAIPVVRKTGGLADTVLDIEDESKKDMANGFVFEGIDEGSIYWALERAFTHYRERPEEWAKMMVKVMEIDNSWNRTAGNYIQVYNSVRVH